MAKLQQVETEVKNGGPSTEAKAPASGMVGTAGSAGVTPCLPPSFADACQFVSAPYSCLVLDTTRRHVALSPMFLKKKKTGIQEQLNCELLKYSESMNGVPLAYDSIKVLGQHGDIYDDQGFIHLNIEATFVIFRPRKGQKLLGVINKVGVSHVGCLVHDSFNASIPKPYQVSVEAWRQAGFAVGDTLEFEVFQLDADAAGVLLIRGRLENKRVEELVALSEQGEDVSVEDSVISKEETIEPMAEDSTDCMKTKKKKKKKDKSWDIEAPTDSQVTAEITADTAGIAEVQVNGRDERKRKKHKSRKGSTEAEEVHMDEVPAVLSDEVHSNKKPKKRKREKEYGADLDADSEPPRTKKKKKKKV
ncbi:DNA-directed RNA polymerase I subunit RPA43 isoform X2 [Paramormyrops kingsleyae]|uniref:DNA-directed RNA polymerase subunit n=1 Tax=Paramormyrops kingsleyae TaxID=1676925 RepID=A0A3B3QZM7_9TELE|nr:DNA-directed RNA polymerase I subunit RPA43 isoform X2 [Paramormyrops kingsleyae]